MTIRTYASSSRPLTPHGLIVDSAGDGEEALGYLRENALP